MPGRPKPKQYERSEQIALICWFRRQFPDELLFAIPNGGSRHPYEAINLKRAGVIAGIPDLMLAAPRKPFHGLFIEMKRGDGKGRVSDSQKQMAECLQNKGYLTIVAHGWDSAKLNIEGYMRGQPWTA